MPKEQRTKLTKTTPVETELGSFSTGVSKTVDMPSVLAAPGAGEQLANIVGIAAKGASRVIQDRDSTQVAEDEITWTRYGHTYGNSEMKRITQLPIEEQEAEYELSLNRMVDTLRRGNISQSALNSALKSGANVLQRGQTAAMMTNLSIATNDKLEAANTTIQAKMLDPEATPESIRKLLADSKLFPDKKALSNAYVAGVETHIRSQWKENPNFDATSTIEKFLKIKTEDNLPLSSNKQVAEVISNLQAEQVRIKNVFQTKNYNTLTDKIVEEGSRTNDLIKDLKIGTDVSGTQYKALENSINNNQTKFYKNNSDQLSSGIDNGTTSAKDVRLAKKENRITEAQADTLERELASYEATVASRDRKLSLERFFTDSNHSFDSYQSMLAEKDSGGNPKYTANEVKAAMKSSVQRAYTEAFAVDEEGNLKPQLFKLPSIFNAASENSIKLDAFDSGLQSLFTKDMAQLSGDSNSQLALIDSYSKYLRMAETNGYISKNAKHFKREAAVLRAELSLDPRGGYETYVSNMSKRSTPLSSSAIAKELGATSLFGENASDVELGYLKMGVYGKDIFNAVYTRTGNKELALQETESYIQDNYTQVDVDGSHMFDDHTMWVPTNTGIVSQESFERVTEGLGEYFDMDDDLQLYATNPLDPNAVWIFTDYDGNVERVFPHELKRLSQGIPTELVFSRRNKELD